MMVLLTKLVNDVNLKTSTILAKDESKMSPECACADWYITVKTWKGQRQVKIESF